MVELGLNDTDWRICFVDDISDIFKMLELLTCWRTFERYISSELGWYIALWSHGIIRKQYANNKLVSSNKWTECCISFTRKNGA